MSVFEQRLKVLFDSLPEKYRERFVELYIGRPTKDGYGAMATQVLAHTIFDDAAERGLSTTEVLAYLVLKLDERVVFLEKHCHQLVQNQTFAGFTVPLTSTEYFKQHMKEKEREPRCANCGAIGETVEVCCAIGCEAEGVFCDHCMKEHKRHCNGI